MTGYDPSVFAAPHMQAAMNIILTPEGGATMASRWAKETPYLARLAIDRLGVGKGDIVLDYGTGIGRIAKPLVEAGAFVVGVDISPEMRALAGKYLATPEFATIAPEMLSKLAVRFDAAVSIWTLQHAKDPEADTMAIRNALLPGGRLFVVNNHRRAVPTATHWVDDGIDIRALLRLRFLVYEEIALDPEIVGRVVADGAFAEVYAAP